MKRKIVLLLILLSIFFIPKIYASECPNGSYKVTYNANGGKGAADPTCVSSVLSGIKPKRSGYKFLGWTDSKNSSVVLYSPGQEVSLSRDIVLYAVWAKGYKVTYNANGGSVSDRSKTVYSNLKYGSLATPKRKGYSFLGWYTSKTDGTLITSESQVTKTKDHTLYAHWKKKKYTITYEFNGGEEVKENKKTYTVTTKTFKLNAPKRKGYVFLGWYKDSKYKSKVTYIYKGTTGNKTLYAKWKAAKYTIQYFGNGATSGKTAIQKSLKYNKMYELSANGFKKKNYVFDSWNTKKDGTGKSYTNKQIVKNMTSKDGKIVKLYARWKRKQYTITYMLDGGTNPSDAYTTYTIVSNITLKEPTREGYEFLGWYEDENFTKKVTGISKGTTGNKTFYAKWKFIAYVINYELNGGALTIDAPRTYIGNSDVTLVAPTRNGYKFEGWYKESTFTNKVTSIPAGSSGNKTFYAKWSVVQYTITYELDGGTNQSGAKTKYTIEEEVTLPTNPTKSNCVFLGWYTNTNHTTEVQKIAKGTTGNKKYYAWFETKVEYTITYNLNGGTNPSGAPTKYTRADEITLPMPTKKGYIFEGWYTESSFTNKVTSIAKGTTGNKTFYAKWSIISYTITYNLNGGTNPSGAKTKYTVEDAYTLPTPTKVGYTFNGWYTESSFTNKVTSIAKGTTGNKTFYAKWTITSYTITYNLNGGTNPSGAKTKYTIDDEYTLPTPTKVGYTFNGWYTESSFTNKVTKIAKGSTGNRTFYAKWTVISYTITYTLNGGTNPSGAKTKYTIEDAYTLPTPTKSGYTFEGWYKESSFTNKVTSIAKGTTGNKTFYAKWTKKTSFTITYVLNGGTNPSGAPTSYTSSAAVTLPTPTKKGYIFNGWYKESSFTNKVTSIPKGSTGDKTFYAKWTVIVYFITYEINGGYNSSDIVLSYTVEDTITLPTPTKSGYSFVGWYKESTFVNKVTSIPKGSTGDKTFYAKWEKLTLYTITYILNGGANPSGAPKGYTIIEEVILPTPTKSGYGFDGWYKESKFTNKVTSIPKGSTGNKTFYAKWGKISTYNITYKLNGGTNPSDAPKTYTNYDEITLPTPTRSGYTFEGWYTESTFQNKVIKITKGSTGDKTFYAKWKTNTLIRNYNYSVYNNSYDNKLTSKNDIKNTLYNIMNEGYTSYTLYCNYSTVDECFVDFASVTGNSDLMKSISDYVNPFNSYETISTTRTSEGKITLSITYTYTSSQKTAINNKIDQAISSNNMGSLSDENKIRKIHDYIVNNTTYSSSGSNAYNAYGTLIDGKSVCQGYADSIALFLDRFNIPNLKISSSTHTWNLIYINNKWLHLDATWDDPVTSNGSQVLLHDYYLLTKAQLYNLDTSEHTFNTNYYPEGN